MHYLYQNAQACQLKICERQNSKQITSILQMEAYKIIYLFALYCNKATHINSSVFNKMSNIFNQVLISMSVCRKRAHFSCNANSTFVYTPNLTSRISHRICTNYASPGRPGGSSCSICSILATPLLQTRVPGYPVPGSYDCQCGFCGFRGFRGFR